MHHYHDHSQISVHSVLLWELKRACIVSKMGAQVTTAGCRGSLRLTSVIVVLSLLLFLGRIVFFVRSSQQREDDASLRVDAHCCDHHLPASLHNMCACKQHSSVRHLSAAAIHCQVDAQVLPWNTASTCTHNCQGKTSLTMEYSFHLHS